MNHGLIARTENGSPQGGVISPFLANIYLDEFDRYMAGRGHRIVRYADDILILKGSPKGAQNALRVAEDYLEGKLKLVVNRCKTHVTELQEGVAFLGVEIGLTYNLQGSGSEDANRIPIPFSAAEGSQNARQLGQNAKIERGTSRNQYRHFQAAIKTIATTHLWVIERFCERNKAELDHSALSYSILCLFVANPSQSHVML